MPTFTLTLSFRGDSGQKLYWESVTKQLQEKGARILNIESEVGKVGEPLTIVNKITVTYEALRSIKYEEEPSH